MKISPSIMCADLLALGETLAELEAAGADGVHIDIMDGHFVPGFTFGADIIRQMKARTRLPLEVHLMADNPLAHIEALLAAGADEIVIPIEGTHDVARALTIVKSAGRRCGVALSPGTPLGAVEAVAAMVDAILVMAVFPGFVGQGQLAGSLDKAARAVDLLKASPNRAEVIVDGGVKAQTIAPIAAAGVHRIVSGSGIFRPDATIWEAIMLLRDRCATPPPATIAPPPRQEGRPA